MEVYYNVWINEKYVGIVEVEEENVVKCGCTTLEELAKSKAGAKFGTIRICDIRVEPAQTAAVPRGIGI